MGRTDEAPGPIAFPDTDAPSQHVRPLSVDNGDSASLELAVEDDLAALEAILAREPLVVMREADKALVWRYRAYILQRHTRSLGAVLYSCPWTEPAQARRAHRYVSLR